MFSPLFTHTFSCIDLFHVPLLLFVPPSLREKHQLPPPTVIDTPVSTLDIVPSLLRLLGADKTQTNAAFTHSRWLFDAEPRRVLSGVDRYHVYFPGTGTLLLLRAHLSYNNQSITSHSNYILGHVLYGSPYSSSLVSICLCVFTISDRTGAQPTYSLNFGSRDPHAHDFLQIRSQEKVFIHIPSPSIYHTCTHPATHTYT